MRGRLGCECPLGAPCFSVSTLQITTWSPCPDKNTAPEGTRGPAGNKEDATSRPPGQDLPGRRVKTAPARPCISEFLAQAAWVRSVFGFESAAQGSQLPTVSFVLTRADDT